LASRGVPQLTIVEKDSSMYDFIKKTMASLGITNMKTIRMDVFKFIAQCTEKFDLIFAGPPYALKNIDDLPKMIFEKKLLNKDGRFILEHTPRNNYKEFPHFKAERNYGTTVFSIFVQES
jgi:16S rRNA G966 N2-methylase RsmD